TRIKTYGYFSGDAGSFTGTGFITASLSGENVILTDAKGNKSTIIMTDVGASNGVIHAIDTVVMP
ncbi:MAG TPA: hypothetical protein DEG69_20960, partial [Flavobacteriaceae bacterium]|nr:hypothetical protein [Flavobacteriaceae bacterium]